MSVIAGRSVRGEGDDACLVALRRPDGRLTFPVPEDASAEAELVDLPRQGWLWSFTVQHFAPKAPYDGVSADGAFDPFIVGYVAFDNGLAIEGYVFDADPANFEIGMPMRVCTRPYRHNDKSAHMIGFRPVSGGER